MGRTLRLNLAPSFRQPSRSIRVSRLFRNMLTSRTPSKRNVEYINMRRIGNGISNWLSGTMVSVDTTGGWLATLLAMPSIQLGMVNNCPSESKSMGRGIKMGNEKKPAAMVS